MAFVNLARCLCACVNEYVSEPVYVNSTRKLINIQNFIGRWTEIRLRCCKLLARFQAFI